MGEQRICDLINHTIKCIDPYSKGIVHSSGHVAVFIFNEKKKELATEGIFFIYRRNAEPYFSLFVNNIDNSKPIIVPITFDMQLKVEPPYLSSRKAQNRK